MKHKKVPDSEFKAAKNDGREDQLTKRKFIPLIMRISNTLSTEK